ncbi:eukaryotic translation initiation factor 4E transporter-like isoform X3 [Sitophilus oryzae]|uniref:Eukaryotic translation initiation factor 4E transporter-like isoform X3 n=1 Tax=Sitophilus oryzae TaxID=7048 RepID=A0A6J2XVY5_SITOR|nr:eukaryotic translation initiation factor 4E transporter-like isoform X3 [Sitophilus oryzae]
MVRVRSQRKAHVASATYNNDQHILNNNNVAVIFSSFKRRQQKPRVKHVSWRDEQLQNMSMGDIDPAILVVREKEIKPRIQYSREKLLEIGENPASKEKPAFLNPAGVSSSILDPEKWNLERKKSDTPETSTKSSDNGDQARRRPGDPRERIRKESDGIVLSPQRRSFNSGCFVPANKEPVRPARPHSPLGGKPEPSHIMGVREIQSNTRRIGSGRIMRDSWGEMADKDGGDNEYSFGRGQSRANDREDKFGERRSFGRDMESNRDRDKEPRRNGRYSERRKYSENKEDEPEWFSSGPISQNDTIELRGFDESEKIKKKSATSRVKRAKEWAKKKGEAQPINEEKDEGGSKQGSARSQQDTKASNSADERTADKKPTDGEKQKKESEEKSQEPSEASKTESTFNFEEFLKCENIPGLLTNGVTDGNKATSRFSRWFKKESPTRDLAESRRSSIQEDNHIIKDLLKDINDSSSVPIAVHPPNDSNAYFAPISPAGNTSNPLGGFSGPKSSQSSMGQPINIMDMLSRGKQSANDGWKAPPPPIGGKILSLDELEAKIRPNVDRGKGQNQKPDEEMTVAFKKLLQQASNQPVSQNGPMHKPQAMSLLEMLNHSQQQDEARFAAAQAAVTQQQHQLLSALHGPPQGAFNDLSMKLQQAQLQKQQMDLLMQQSRELLNRPEAQAILQAMHQRIPSPRELQVHTQNILQRALIKKKLEEQTENFRKKQEMQRGTSPNPVAGGPQSGGSKGVSSPTPLAFTPTSVLRKMTADKDEGKENKIIGDNGLKPQGRPLTGMRPQPQVPVNNQWNAAAYPMKQAGRPIIKASNTFQSQTPEHLFAQIQQQQQQPQTPQRIYQTVPNQQQRKPIVGQQYSSQGSVSSQYGSAPNQYSRPNPQSFAQPQAQLTAQQLRAQHQHRPSNTQPQKPAQTLNSQQQPANASWQQFLNSAAQQQGNRGQQSGSLSPSTSDQLARWFSPDLLERARGGELPSTANLARHALSLEEIERQAAPPVHN